MTAKTTPAPLTRESLRALVALAGTLKTLGVHEITNSHLGPTVQLERPQLLEAVAAVEVVPEVFSTKMPTVFDVQFGTLGAKFCGLVTAEDLPSIGYHLVDGKPVRQTA